MKYLGVAGVLLGLSLLGVPALADEAKQPVPRVGQVVIESMGPASGTIPKGKLATIVNYIHADKHTWYKNGSRHTAKYPFNKGTQRNLHDRFVLKMRYGLGDGYDVRFATPIVMNNFRAHSTLTPNSVSSKNGIGDTTFVLHKQFLSQREGSPVDMAWDLGVWTPTGGTSDDGVGTGAWGAMAGLGVGHAFDGGNVSVKYIFWNPANLSACAVESSTAFSPATTLPSSRALSRPARHSPPCVHTICPCRLARMVASMMACSVT